MLFKIQSAIKSRLVSPVKMLLIKIFEGLLKRAANILNVELIDIDIGRIGHAIIPWIYLCDGNKTDARLVLFLYSSTGFVSNSQWKTMWCKYIKTKNINIFFEAKIILFIRNILNLIKPNYNFPLPDPMNNQSLVSSAWKNDLVLVPLTKQEEKKGREILLANKINMPMVCVFARDSEYLNNVYPERDWSYHDYRNSDIRECIPACKALVDKGFTVLRVGSLVKQALDTGNPKIFDYSSSEMKSDFMDIYLSAKCSFFIGADSGITQPVEIFLRPVVYHNWVLINRISRWVKNGIFVFKKLWLDQEKRFVTFEEQINNPIYHSHSVHTYAENGVTLIENTSSDITDAALEMYLRLSGEWKESHEDLVLQNKFWRLFGQEITRSENLRVGSKFLRKNCELLS